jgi:hyperosmotically inducible periplasmic protein
MIKPTKIVRLIMGMASLLWMTGTQASETDTRIEDEFHSRISANEDLKDKVRGESKDEVLVLIGEVADHNQKRVAENAAGEIPGVKRVDNQLQIKGDRDEKNDDGVNGRSYPNDINRM